MIGVAALALLIQGAAVTPSTAPVFPVQLGVSVRPDTVTVGQRFVVVMRIRAPRGATVEFPVETDSAASASPTATQLIGKPAIQSVKDSTGTTVTAAYQFAAWDVGSQPLGLSDIVVRFNGTPAYVSLRAREVFVRSVLPEDSALRIPKPARPPIPVPAFNWIPWLIALATLAGLGLGWRFWVWYRRRSELPLEPFAAAEREFNRVEAMQLVRAGQGELHVALMTDIMRDYLANRVAGLHRAQTSSELLAAAGRIHSGVSGLGELLWRADLVKFANSVVASDEAERLGASARSIVVAVEKLLLAEEENQSRTDAAA